MFFRPGSPLPLACLLGSALASWSGCGQDAEETFAGMSTLVVGQPDGIGYRLRYLNPPWENVADDPLVRDAPEARVQYGLLDGMGASALADLKPSAHSSRVLEIDRTGQAAVPIDGIITFPKYRLEVSILRCADLGIAVAQQDTCARTLNVADVNGRTGVELNVFFGQDGRSGENHRGQAYHEFMTQVPQTSRYRRVVYYETKDPLVTIRLGFEANPPLSELEVTQMIDAFEVLDDELQTSAPIDLDGASGAGTAP